MLSSEQLIAMSQIALPDIDKDMLVEISTVTVDTTLPGVERMESYLEQIKNPYCFRCGNTAVRVRFEPNGDELSTRLKGYFMGLKKK